MFEVGNKYTFFGKVIQSNESTYETYPTNVLTEENEMVIVRIPQDKTVFQNKVYQFNTTAVAFKDKVHLEADSFQIIGEMDLNENRREELLKFFYHYAPIKVEEISKDIENVIDGMSNKPIKEITETIYNRYRDDFYLYPAATKFHHAYISGLAYHTHSMLKLAEGFLKVYSFLNEDLLNAGIILHDICKIFEFDSFEGSEYTIKGKLIGHIAMGVTLVSDVAKELGYKDAEETLLLEHIILSHHYYGNYGSPKKPNIAEALIIHFIDNVDSKTCVLGEELNTVEIGDLTSPIAVLEREKYYKHKLTKN